MCGALQITEEVDVERSKRRDRSKGGIQSRIQATSPRPPRSTAASA
jgi:hypothetical protein